MFSALGGTSNNMGRVPRVPRGGYAPDCMHPSQLREIRELNITTELYYIVSELVFCVEFNKV